MIKSYYGRYGDNDTTAVVPTCLRKFQYYIEYSMPNIDGYTFLCCFPNIGWSNDNAAFPFQWNYHILTQQSGRAEMLFDEEPIEDGIRLTGSFIPHFTCIYIKI